MSPACGIIAVYALLSSTAAALEGQIQDNSFLLEEAYNQESGVVQHINTVSFSSGQDWGYAFSQEWPLGGIRHQLSYTVPIQRSNDGGTGVGDVALNYRYQLAGHPEAGFVAAPRLSLLLPTGNEERGRGAGGVGVQANIPVSLVLSKALVAHWNAGLTLTPESRNSLRREATTAGFNLGASAVWLLHPSFNLLVETLWLSEEIVLAEGATQRDETAVLSPGFRAAFDLAGGLQVVPGLAYTFYLTSGEAEEEAFIYLSFEHTFKRQ